MFDAPRGTPSHSRNVQGESHRHELHELPPTEVFELLTSGRAELIDVREDEERAAAHIAGSRHIELGRLAQEASSIDRDRPVVFVCHVGARSAYATGAFRAAGYDAYNLTGGIAEWERSGLPVERG